MIIRPPELEPATQLDLDLVYHLGKNLLEQVIGHEKDFKRAHASLFVQRAPVSSPGLGQYRAAVLQDGPLEDKVKLGIIAATPPNGGLVLSWHMSGFYATQLNKEYEVDNTARLLIRPDTGISAYRETIDNAGNRKIENDLRFVLDVHIGKEQAQPITKRSASWAARFLTKFFIEEQRVA